MRLKELVETETTELKETSHHVSLTWPLGGSESRALGIGEEFSGSCGSILHPNLRVVSFY